MNTFYKAELASSVFFIILVVSFSFFFDRLRRFVDDDADDVESLGVFGDLVTNDDPALLLFPLPFDVDELLSNKNKASWKSSELKFDSCICKTLLSAPSVDDFGNLNTSRSRSGSLADFDFKPKNTWIQRPIPDLMIS